MQEALKGSCLCGAVHYEANSTPVIVGNCYCVDCRKSSGTSHCTHAAVPEDTVTLSGELTFYGHPADSGNLVSRGFCPSCGSAIFSRNSGMPGMAFLRASSLDNPDAIATQMTVYASRAPKWALIDHSNPVFEEMVEGGMEAVLKS